eukprot:336834-Prymnesium_polylepis.1
MPSTPDELEAALEWRRLLSLLPTRSKQCLDSSREPWLMDRLLSERSAPQHRHVWSVTLVLDEHLPPRPVERRAVHRVLRRVAARS